MSDKEFQQIEGWYLSSGVGAEGDFCIFADKGDSRHNASECCVNKYGLAWGAYSSVNDNPELVPLAVVEAMIAEFRRRTGDE